MQTASQLAALSIKAATEPSPTMHKLVAAHSWRFDVFHPELAPIMPEAQRFCSDILNNLPPRWLSILGPSGVGKTYALTQAFNFMAERVRRCGWKIKVHSGWRGPTIAHIKPCEDLLDYRADADFAKYDLLYIEDIGAGGTQADKGPGVVIRDRVIRLLQARTQKWTLIDANLSISEIARLLDPRIASRLKRDGSTCIKLSGDVPDYNAQADTRHE